ncbi:hypothetical protein JZ785_09205 [Alicyclobacillus curvatus]|jgi:hypothetical protein|nr:hypothetical protein JZ785_09205 [Alicyclobacillus curvatus]
MKFVRLQKLASRTANICCGSITQSEEQGGSNVQKGPQTRGKGEKNERKKREKGPQTRDKTGRTDEARRKNKKGYPE